MGAERLVYDAFEQAVKTPPGRPASGDGFHLLIMDLHKEITRLQNAISTEEVDGAKAYAITDGDRPLIAAFMRGVTRTTRLKFEHAGLETTVARSGDTLLIQNDLGTTAAHVLVVHVAGKVVLVTIPTFTCNGFAFFRACSKVPGCSGTILSRVKVRRLLSTICSTLHAAATKHCLLVGILE
jgi:hypothetical protein